MTNIYRTISFKKLQKIFMKLRIILLKYIAKLRFKWKPRFFFFQIIAVKTEIILLRHWSPLILCLFSHSIILISNTFSSSLVCYLDVASGIQQLISYRYFPSTFSTVKHTQTLKRQCHRNAEIPFFSNYYPTLNRHIDFSDSIYPQSNQLLKCNYCLPPKPSNLAQFNI